MEYDVKAIPTVYAGVRFRSRLEARWAAFFDLCDWDWRYEPTILSKWCPDFELVVSGAPIYCEIKPVCIFARPDHLRRDFAKALRPFPTLLLGRFPESANRHDDGSCSFDFHGDDVALGVLCENGGMRPWLCDLDPDVITYRWKRACRRIKTSKKSGLK